MHYNHPTETSITEMSYIEPSTGLPHETAPESSSFRSPSSPQSPIPTSRPFRRRKSFSPKRRREVAAVRKVGACGSCRKKKIRVRINQAISLDCSSTHMVKCVHVLHSPVGVSSNMFHAKGQVVLPIQAVVQKARQSNDGDKTRQQTEVFMREGTDLECQMSCWPVHLSHDEANFPVQRLSDGLIRPWDIVTGQEMIAPRRRRPQHINVALKAYSDENRGPDFVTKINRHGPPSTSYHAISDYPAPCNPSTFPVFLDTVEKTACQPSLPVGFECFISDPFELAFQLPLYTSNLDRSTWDTPVAPDEGPYGPISNSYEDRRPVQTEMLEGNRNIPWLWPTTSQNAPPRNFDTSGPPEVSAPDMKALHLSSFLTTMESPAMYPGSTATYT
jgi:hypothetical protein